MFTYQIVSAKKSSMTNLADGATYELPCFNFIKYPLSYIKKL
jgi:hypothetical protein